MNPVLIYIIKVAFYIAAFYLVYSLFLSKDTQYGRNRVFILLSLAASLILPLITIKTGRPANIPIIGKTLEEVLITGTRNGIDTPAGSLDRQMILLIIYFSGVLVSVFIMLSDLGRLLFMMSDRDNKKNHIIRFNGLSTPAFSAFGHIFINTRLAPEEAAGITRHEQNHIDKNHFSDIVLMQVFKSFQWFNPVIYMFDRSLRAVHEYQADENCIISGIEVVSYQQLLMNQILDTRLFSITNSFSNPALIKKRMIMMTKKRSGTLANLKILMVLPVVAVVMLAFSSCKEKSVANGSAKVENQSVAGSNQAADSVKKVQLGTTLPPGENPPPPPPPPPPVAKGDTANTPPFVQVDVMPEFQGGDAGILNYIAKNTIYPEEAKKKGITGKVIVRFAVETDGSIDKISILRGVDQMLDAEALRVVSTLPHFTKPALIKGKPVPVWYMLPINFTLK